MEYLKSLRHFDEYIDRVGVVYFFTSLNILPANKQCLNCDRGIMHLKLNGKNKDLVYQCGSKGCRKKRSARKNTFFSVSQIHFRVLIQVIICWLLRYPSGVISRETEVSNHTLRSILIGLRELLRTWLLENAEKIGGNGLTVEIDESAFGKRKPKRGSLQKTRWVVGGIDRVSKRSFLVLVNNSREETLNKVILENVAPDTHIVTDMWRGYISINSNPSDRNVHTQNIECHWSKIKRDMRRRIGKMCVSRMDDYLVEYVWRSTRSEDQELFLDFIRALQYFYPIN